MLQKVRVNEKYDQPLEDCDGPWQDEFGKMPRPDLPSKQRRQHERVGEPASWAASGETHAVLPP